MKCSTSNNCGHLLTKSRKRGKESPDVGVAHGIGTADAAARPCRDDPGRRAATAGHDPAAAPRAHGRCAHVAVPATGSADVSAAGAGEQRAAATASRDVRRTELV